MSVQSVQGQVVQIQKDIASLHRKLAEEVKREADHTKRALQIGSSITKSTSATTAASRNREVAQERERASKSKDKQASLQVEIARKTERLHEAEKKLREETEREEKHRRDDERRRQQEQERRRKQEEDRYRRELARELGTQRTRGRAESVPQLHLAAKEYDLFISYASEDIEFVEPLAQALRERGYRVWFDRFALTVGDNLRRKIEEGIAHSRFGVVVLSAAFFAKGWPQYELDGLVAREVEGVKVILPIWHKVSKDEVRDKSPALAIKLALNSSMMSIDEIVAELSRVLDPVGSGD